jgi:hypothetical protein
VSARYWKTKGGVLVREVSRTLALNRGGLAEVKIHAERAPSGGYHGWLWLKNLKPAKAPMRWRGWVKS